MLPVATERAPRSDTARSQRERNMLFSERAKLAGAGLGAMFTFLCKDIIDHGQIEHAQSHTGRRYRDTRRAEAAVSQAASGQAGSRIRAEAAPALRGRALQAGGQARRQER